MTNVPRVHLFRFRPAVWEYPTGKHIAAKEGYALEHPVLMPEQIAKDFILSWSKVGDLIVDPFVGGGTAMKMAMLNHRSYLSFESNSKHVEITQRRITDAENKMTSNFRKAK